MIGCASFIFKTPQSAFTFLVTWFLILGVMIMLISTVVGAYLAGLANAKQVFDMVQSVCAILVPPYAVSHSRYF